MPDLNDSNWQMDKEIGLKVAIGTDAHGRSDLDSMRFGIDTHAWLGPDDVINTRKLQDPKKRLNRRSGALEGR